MLAFVACAMSAQLGKPPRALPEEPERYTVDGVALGMTVEEVRERWGDLKVSGPWDGYTHVSKPGETASLVPGLTLDSSGRVVSVTGIRLKKGGRLLMSTEHPFESGSNLGEPIESNARGFCGTTGGLIALRRVDGNNVFIIEGLDLEEVRLPEGKKPEDFREVYPDLKIPVSITLESRQYYNRFSEN